MASLVLPSLSCSSTSFASSLSTSSSSRRTDVTSLTHAFSSLSGLSLSSLSSKSSPSFAAACRISSSSGETSSGRAVVRMGAMEAGIGLLGNKVGMLTWFTPEGKALPCTAIVFKGGNVITQVKTPETDGYSAVQVAYEPVRPKLLTKPQLGHLKKALAGSKTEGEGEGEAEEEEVIALRQLQEFRLQSVEGYEPGQQLKVEEIFKEGDLIDISGISIGKGFQGGIRAHNFARGAMTHGSKSHRQLGSIGPGTTPGRVYPGKKMPKRIGNEKVKIRKLTVVKIDTELSTIIVKGSVPGKPGNLLRLAPAKIVGKNIPKQ